MVASSWLVIKPPKKKTHFLYVETLSKCSSYKGCMQGRDEFPKVSRVDVTKLPTSLLFSDQDRMATFCKMSRVGWDLMRTPKAAFLTFGLSVSLK